MANVSDTINLVSKMNELVYENQKKVFDIIETMKRAVNESSKETYEYRVKAYQEIIDKINNHSTQICKQQENVIENWKQLSDVAIGEKAGLVEVI